MYINVGPVSGFGGFTWQTTTCGGEGDATGIGAGELACVTASDERKATSRGCVPTSRDGARGCASGGSLYCCPERGSVRVLQQAIAASGCAVSGHTIDGLWGPKTAQGAYCQIEREGGYAAAVDRFPVLRGLVDAPERQAEGESALGPITGTVRNIVEQPYGSGAPTWTYVAVGAATLVLGFAVSQMLRKREEEREELEREFRPSLAGAAY